MFIITLPNNDTIEYDKPITPMQIATKISKNLASEAFVSIVDGELWAKLPGQDEFKPYTNADQFEVPANASFDVKVMRPTAYLCTYE